MDVASGFTPPSYVVLGTSAGGAAALARIFKDLPEDFPGAILVVMHVPRGFADITLPRQLVGVGRVPVKIAEDGEPIVQGRAYVAPPSTHLVVEEGRLRLGSGPPEQYARPAIDVLFRSAAAAYGHRVIGVVLTGMLRDGTLGLRAVRDAGGITIVQNPETAEQGDMPRSAMRDLPVDYCVDLPEIGTLLDLLVRRAGSRKEGVLETGLAASVRLMESRVLLLAKLLRQSQRNAKTTEFLEAEIVSLDADIVRIRELIAEAIAAASAKVGTGDERKPS